jgi:hypothetical protein
MKNQTQFLTVITLALCLLIDLNAQAETQNFNARDQGPSAEQMLARSNGGIDGMAFFRPVLSGVLYRAGFSGGDKSHTGLSAIQRQDLCKAGFSNAFYVDFGSNTDFNSTDCGENKLDYHKANSANTHEAMKVIHDIIKNPSKGPALVHCMWGVHSSGSVAAMALVQFCGWSETQAKSYWEKARNNANCSGGCDKWIDGKFKQLKVDPTLTISSEEQQRICPK